MSSQFLISEQQHHLLTNGKEDNLIDDNLSYKMMLMMSKMNESTSATSQALNQYQQQNNSGNELIIKDHSMNESIHRATPPPPQLGSKSACNSCPVFESHYWRLVGLLLLLEISCRNLECTHSDQPLLLELRIF